MTMNLIEGESKNNGMNHVNWIAIGADANRASASMPVEYWNRSSRTGYLGVYVEEPGYEGFQRLPDNGNRVYVSPQNCASFQDIYAARRALSPYQEMLHQVLAHSKLNTILAFLGKTFTSGIIPSMAKASSEEGAVTIAIVSTPHEDETRKHILQSKFAIDDMRPCADATCVISLDNLVGNLAQNSLMHRVDTEVNQLFTRAMRGIVDLSCYPGFRAPDLDEIVMFFRGAGDILFGYAPLESKADGPIVAVRTALSAQFDSRKFETAEQILVSVCLGSDGMDADTYYKIGRFCRKLVDQNIDVIVGCFYSNLAVEQPWIAVYGRGIRETRYSGFDFPDTQLDQDDSAPELPAYYRKHYGQVMGGLLR